MRAALRELGLEDRVEIVGWMGRAQNVLGTREPGPPRRSANVTLPTWMAGGTPHPRQKQPELCKHWHGLAFRPRTVCR